MPSEFRHDEGLAQACRQQHETQGPAHHLENVAEKLPPQDLDRRAEIRRIEQPDHPGRQAQHRQQDGRAKQQGHFGLLVDDTCRGGVIGDGRCEARVVVRPHRAEDEAEIGRGDRPGRLKLTERFGAEIALHQCPRSRDCRAR